MMGAHPRVSQGRYKPILFSSAMVRALLDGTKTQTRRILKPQPNMLNGGKPLNDGRGSYSIDGGWKRYPIAAGGRLWVREAWACHWSTDDQKPREIEPGLWSVRYFADDHIQAAARDGSLATLNQCQRKRPSMFMPRWASRLTLTVTDVRVERLRDISEDDAFAEGIETDVWDMAPVARRYGTEGWFVGWETGILHPSVSVDAATVCRCSYASLWDQINGAGSWDANPWVAAYTFTVERRNIDMGRATLADAHSNPPPPGEPS